MTAIIQFLNTPFHPARPQRGESSSLRTRASVVGLARFFAGPVQSRSSNGAGMGAVSMNVANMSLVTLLTACGQTAGRNMGWCGHEDPQPPGQAPKRFDVALNGMTMDSRQVRQGDLFVALGGSGGHGLQYLDKALAAGAAAVLWEPDPDSDWQSFVDARCKWIPAVRVEGLRGVIGHLANLFYDAPSHHLRVVGITGTDGKTSIAQLLAAAMNLNIDPADSAYGHQCGVLGTMGNGFTDDLQPALNTTADVISVHGWLAGFRAAGAEHAAMEVSSHGLDQDRVQAVRFDTAVFTNLSRDHLDYHQTVEAYARAKRRLFEMEGLKHAVINAADAFGQSLLNKPVGSYSRVAYGTAQFQAQVSAEQRVIIEEVRAGRSGLYLRLAGDFGDFAVQTRLLGLFNGDNLAAIYAVMRLAGFSNEQLLRRFESLTPVKGRMEAVQLNSTRQLPLVVVDYAHTPAALELAQLALQAHVTAEGRLLTVFGCGGDRDKGKRPMMGRVAQQHSDAVWVTDDNPRTEDPEAIIRGILQGLDQADTTPVKVQPDRAKAIHDAIAQAKAGDIVLIAGKGHEDYQWVGDQRLWFSDQQCAAQVLSDMASETANTSGEGGDA